MSTPLSKSEARKRETHEKLLDAARQAFAQYGYERASVNQIIDLANSSKGAFYHHFESKEQIFLELMDQRLEAQREALRGAVLTGKVGGLEDLLALSVDTGFNVYQNKDWAPLYMEFWSYATRNEALRVRMAEMYQKWRSYLSDLILEAQQAGAISREVNAPKTAGMIIAIFEGMQLQLLMEEDVLSPLDIVKLLLRMLRPTRTERERETDQRAQ